MRNTAKIHSFHICLRIILILLVYMPYIGVEMERPILPSSSFFPPSSLKCSQSAFMCAFNPRAAEIWYLRRIYFSYNSFFLLCTRLLSVDSLLLSLTIRHLPIFRLFAPNAFLFFVFISNATKIVTTPCILYHFFRTLTTST